MCRRPEGFGSMGGCDANPFAQEAQLPPNEIVFIDSSSIMRWTTLANDMAPLTTIDRGFGAATQHDVIHGLDTLTPQARPRAFVLYEGILTSEPSKQLRNRWPSGSKRRLLAFSNASLRRALTSSPSSRACCAGTCGQRWSEPIGCFLHSVSDNHN